MRRAPLALALLALAACHSPQSPAPEPAQAPAGQSKMQPQFTFASWSVASRYIRDGKVIQTVAGKVIAAEIEPTETYFVSRIAKMKTTSATSTAHGASAR